MSSVTQSFPKDGKAAVPDPESQAGGVESEGRSDHQSPKRKSPQSATQAKDATSDGSKKKRRKVNHACLYCRRSHMTCDQKRPCSRCIKRSIGHLCHDEPREHQRRSDIKLEDDVSRGDNQASELSTSASAGLTTLSPLSELPLDSVSAPSSQSILNDPNAKDGTVSSEPLDTFTQPYHGYNNGWANGSSDDAFADMQDYHSNYMFNTSELSNEYNLLNDFLSNNILDDKIYQGDPSQTPTPLLDASLTNTMGPLSTPNGAFATGAPRAILPNQKRKSGASTPRPPKSFPNEKAKENYFMTAADPAGTDTPEERMNKLLKAKYDAGMLKPFNYVNGYKRLMEWMEANVRAASREVILQQFKTIRPKFRERAQQLTDMELVLVEIWFERKLMEYDRVFASMAIPACCWRRTGEIFRGNREMCELIGVPLEQLRDGKLGLHQILTEESLVSYWVKFTAIAFDTSQKAILTACSLKISSSSQYGGQDLRCCFSFTVTRDLHQVPALIVGNFLPVPKEEA